MLRLEYKNYTLNFKFEAGTSRGILREHPVVILKVSDPTNPVVYGLGEAAPLEKLSPEQFEELEPMIITLAAKLKTAAIPKNGEEVVNLVDSTVPKEFPSIRFAMETALLDLLHGGKRMIFDNDFARGETMLPINGLIWMGDAGFMKEQMDQKLDAGFKCIKMKIGAIDFDEELKMLEYLRSKSKDITIRVDANGAFKNNEVFKNIDKLEPFNIHSIEQPIMPKQWEAMQLVCQKSPIPIALDEELIGVNEFSQKQELLKFLQPKYLILKPTLLGGFKATEEWIRLADQLGIAWWFTSALESNVGLNAIAQFASKFDKRGYQGLGTGQLYTNNFESPLEISGEYLGYDIKKQWKVNLF